MKLFYFCFSSLSIAWLIHLLVWRYALPSKHTKTLINIFMTVYFIFIISYIFLTNRIDYIYLFHFTICYIPSFLAYICLYSAIEENSPSVSLIKLTELKGTCCLEDYKEIINNELLIGSRLEAMIRDGLLEHDKRVYRLTNKGELFGMIFSRASSFFNFKYAG